MTLLSRCCASEVRLDNQADLWICVTCQRPCGVEEDNRTAYQPRHAAPPLRCRHCTCDIFLAEDGRYADSLGLTVCMATPGLPGEPAKPIYHTPLP